jgi:hypothetical protein
MWLPLYNATFRNTSRTPEWRKERRETTRKETGVISGSEVSSIHILIPFMMIVT